MWASPSPTVQHQGVSVGTPKVSRPRHDAVVGDLGKDAHLDVGDLAAQLLGPSLWPASRRDIELHLYVLLVPPAGHLDAFHLGADLAALFAGGAPGLHRHPKGPLALGLQLGHLQREVHHPSISTRVSLAPDAGEEAPRSGGSSSRCFPLSRFWPGHAGLRLLITMT